ncbi:DUF2911 domain-containing protein [Flavobacterium sp. MAH-1]|uniref:DUF2911 domain-containing protein n=1 Tax=Flavobacterium agri TaxID=2743471 RepID=A0A7Y8XZH0_9FLAO|nr:DUF2911 domain-containing protein [Flavobacterium agri]NUY79764.1 DUF2911 domain-containing protein [Flavobacterium agri]NYA69789.1 DUF2911 domain-containing protein [Flavobacterium agri]
MKKIIIALAILIANYTIEAQVKAPAASPKASFSQVVGLTDVEVEYSRPSLKGRTVYGDLVPFGKVWRTGANNCTTISFSEDVTIDGKTLKKGKYALYTVPRVDNWDVIFYDETSNWGTPENWDESKVALKTSAKPFQLNRTVESFTIDINNLDNNYGVLEIMWEKTLIPVKFEVPTAKTAMASIDKTLNGPSSTDYYSAGTYLYQSNGDMNKALSYVNKALELSKEKPFWMLRQKSLIQAKLGDKKGAIETAKVSLASAQAAKNQDYIKLNNDSIAEWSKG